jgi:riboflavin-specific deaminase-like protein
MTDAAAWALVAALAARARAGRPLTGDGGVRLDDRGALLECAEGDAWIRLLASARRGWTWPPAGAPAGDDVGALFDLYLPLCAGPGSGALVVGHLAQSLDGRIATVSGVSQFITGAENLLHAHRMRALCDAVLVGAKTVRKDDPQLTTRLCPGPNPVRVILDPQRRLSPEQRVFTDGAAPTLLVCAAEAARGSARHGQAEIVAIGAREGLLPVGAIVEALAQRGLRRVFIEGGGVTLSRFLQARALTRLHLAVAPVLFGSGRPSISLPVIDDLADALRLDCCHFASGRDLLFDCVLSRPEP